MSGAGNQPALVRGNAVGVVVVLVASKDSVAELGIAVIERLREFGN